MGAIIDVDLVGNPLVAAFLLTALLDYGLRILVLFAGRARLYADSRHRARNVVGG